MRPSQLRISHAARSRAIVIVMRQMQICPKAVACIAPIADELILLHHGSWCHRNRGHVCMAWLLAVAVVDKYIVAIGIKAVVAHAAVPASLCISHSPGGTGVDGIDRNH